MTSTRQPDKNLDEAWKSKVIVFLPTLNEELGAPLVIKGLQEQGLREIVAVDGGSKDGTVAACRKQGAFVMEQEGKGKGEVFKIFLASYPLEDDSIVVMLDADASYSPSDAPKLVLAIMQGAEVASGNRKILVHDFTSLVHVACGRLGALLASLLYFKWHPDVTSGYWALRGSALKKICVDAQGFELEANLFAETAKKGLKLQIVPVGYQKRLGKVKFSPLDALKVLYAFFKYRF